MRLKPALSALYFVELALTLGIWNLALFEIPVVQVTALFVSVGLLPIISTRLLVARASGRRSVLLAAAGFAVVIWLGALVSAWASPEGLPGIILEGLTLLCVFYALAQMSVANLAFHFMRRTRANHPSPDPP